MLVSGAPGGRYDPLLDMWTPIAFQSFSNQWWSSPAVWTGHYVVYWNGQSGGGWRHGRSPTPGCRSPRPMVRRFGNNMTAVRTGHQMIVWGGIKYPNPFPDDGQAVRPGGRPVVPMLRRARPRLAQATLPSGRGTMIVWRGNNAGTSHDRRPLPPGASDKLATDATSGSLAGRQQSTAICSGSEMIVWGGQTNTEGATIRRATRGRRRAPGTRLRRVSRIRRSGPATG